MLIDQKKNDRISENSRISLRTVEQFKLFNWSLDEVNNAIKKLIQKNKMKLALH